MRIAFFGDVVGRAGRDGLADHLPGLRRKLALDFVVINAENAAAGFGITESHGPRAVRQRRRLPDPGQPQLGPEGGADLYRPRAPPDPSAELSAPGRRAGPRRPAHRDAERPAGAGHQPAGPGAHGRPGRPLRRRGPRAGGLPAGDRRRRHPRRHACRGDEREDGHGSFLRRAAPVLWWAPTPTCQPPTARSCPPAPPTRPTPAPAPTTTA
jgi:hypothetical protein